MIKKISKKLILIVTFFLFFSNSAFAYLDPGTGSIILQAILAAIAAGLVTMKIWWQNLKSFLSKIFNSKKEDDKVGD